MSMVPPAGFNGQAYPCESGQLWIECDSKKYPSIHKQRYEDAAFQVLDNIYGDPIGETIIEYLASSERNVVIIPESGPVAKTVVRKDMVQHGFPLGQRVRLCADTGYRKAGGRKWGKKFVGTGIGGNAGIEFTPIRYYGHSSPGGRQDEVLLHELIHALRIVTATESCVRFGHGMDTVEEVIAITLTNLYSASRKRILRKDHHGTVPMGMDPKNWIAQMKPVLAQFAEQQKALVAELKRWSPPHFSPFAGL